MWFNIFPKVKTVEEIKAEINTLFPPTSWATYNTFKDKDGKDITTDQLVKTYNSLLEIKESLQRANSNYLKKIVELESQVSELSKENKNLNHLKQENTNLLELLSKYKDGYQGSCYACEPVGILNQKQEKEIEKLNLQITALHKIIEGAKTKIDNQKHPMYPIHWGGYTDETPWETAAADLALRVVKLEKKVEELKLINTSLFVNKKHDK